MAIVETVLSVAASIGDATDRRTGEVLAHVALPGGADEQGCRMQSSVLMAATVMLQDPARGKLLALENSGWKQARVEGLRVAAEVAAQRPDLLSGVVGDLRNEIDTRT